MKPKDINKDFELNTIYINTNEELVFIYYDSYFNSEFRVRTSEQAITELGIHTFSHEINELSTYYKDDKAIHIINNIKEKHMEYFI